MLNERTKEKLNQTLPTRAMPFAPFLIHLDLPSTRYNTSLASRTHDQLAPLPFLPLEIFKISHFFFHLLLDPGYRNASS